MTHAPRPPTAAAHSQATPAPPRPPRETRRPRTRGPRCPCRRAPSSGQTPFWGSRSPTVRRGWRMGLPPQPRCPRRPAVVLSRGRVLCRTRRGRGSCRHLTRNLPRPRVSPLAGAWPRRQPQTGPVGRGPCRDPAREGRGGKSRRPHRCRRPRHCHCLRPKGLGCHCPCPCPRDPQLTANRGLAQGRACLRKGGGRSRVQRGSRGERRRLHRPARASCRLKILLRT